MNKTEELNNHQVSNNCLYNDRIISGIKISVLFILLLLLGGSCATYNKHRKIKAAPCPCETQQRG